MILGGISVASKITVKAACPPAFYEDVFNYECWHCRTIKELYEVLDHNFSEGFPQAGIGKGDYACKDCMKLYKEIEWVFKNKKISMERR